MRTIRDRGYALIPDVLNEAGLAAARRAADEVLARVTAATDPETVIWPDGHRLDDVSCDGVRCTVHWEPGVTPPAVRSVSPATALHPALAALWAHPALVAAAGELIGPAAVAGTGPFTCKLNVKRARVGSAYHWHQDYPFWFGCIGPDAADVVNAMVLLDDAGPDNGALRLVRGSHRAGPVPRDHAEPTRMLADPARVATDRAVTATAPAGSALVFSGLLVHGSPPNRSDRDRRAVLLCFQPAGRPALDPRTFDERRMAELP